jgi:hypothetical protein
LVVSAVASAAFSVVSFVFLAAFFVVEVVVSLDDEDDEACAIARPVPSNTINPAIARMTNR